MGSDGVAPRRFIGGTRILIGTIAALCLAAICVSCSGGRGLLHEVDTPAVGMANLPPPSALRHVSYDPAKLVSFGSDYIDVAGFPLQNVSQDNDYGDFAPNWTPAAPDPAGLAYACYGFDMTDYDRAEQITFTWDQQGDPGDLWIGLSDYTRDSWSWHSLSGGSTLALPLADYIDPDTKRMLVLPLTTGTTPWELSRVQVGDLASVNGHVYEADGETPLADAEVVLEGDQVYSMRTGNDGAWSFTGVPPGDYEVTAYLIGWSFTPASIELTVDQLVQTVDDIVGTQPPSYSASGSVMNMSGGGVNAVEMQISLQGSTYGGVSTWTDVNGLWSIDLPDGDYTVTPKLPAWSFEPESRDFSVAGGNALVIPFIGSKLPGYEMGGYIYQADGSTPLPDVLVTVTNTGVELTYYATTDGDGFWLVPDAITGNYTVEPELYGWTFTPPERSVIVAGGTTVVDPFVGEELGKYTLDGYIYLDGGSTPLEGVNVELSGDFGAIDTTTNGDGYYAFADVYEGDYTVLPSELGYGFDPAQQDITLTADTTLDPFYATALPDHQVDGYIYETDGTTGIEGVQVSVSAYLPPGASFEASTDGDGYWQLPAVPPAYYTVEPQKEGYTFEPPEQSIQVEDSDLTVDDFIGTPLATYAMEGYVFKQDGFTPLSDVTILIDSLNYSYEATSDTSGHWSLGGVLEDTYTVTPMLAPWQFSPPSREVLVSGGDVLVGPFAGEELAAWSVDGYVYVADSTTPVPGVDIWFYSDPLTYRCTTDENGHYELPLPNGDWEAAPDTSNWTFEPPTQSFTISGAPLTLDVFYATPLS